MPKRLKWVAGKRERIEAAIADSTRAFCEAVQYARKSVPEHIEQVARESNPLIRLVRSCREWAKAGCDLDSGIFVTESAIAAPEGSGPDSLCYLHVFIHRIAVFDEWTCFADKVARAAEHTGEWDAIARLALSDRAITVGPWCGNAARVACSVARWRRSDVLSALMVLEPEMMEEHHWAAADNEEIHIADAAIIAHPLELWLGLRERRKHVATGAEQNVLNEHFDRLQLRIEDASRPSATLAEVSPPAIGFPTMGDLVTEAGIGDDTFRRVRTAAGITVKEKGAAARNRRYSPHEVDLLIVAALAGTFMERRTMAEKWARWGSAKAASKPHSSK